MTFNDAITLWLEEKRHYIKESTYSYYRFEIYHYWSPLLGNMKLNEITEEYIQKIVLQWQTRGLDNKHPLKKSTIQNLIVLLKQFLKYALRKDWINSSSKVEIHFAKQNTIHQQNVFSPAEQKKIINAVLADLNDKSFGILLALNTGLRIGELCALKWCDIELQEGILHVNKTLQRVYNEKGSAKTQIIITEPKTNTSIRDIPLGKQILVAINKLNTYNSQNYLLTSSEQPLEPRSYRNFYNKFLDKNGIACLHFHCLRHTFATQCIEYGADYKCVSEILGHSTINMTMNMYVHPLMETKRKCVEMIMKNIH